MLTHLLVVVAVVLRVVAVVVAMAVTMMPQVRWLGTQSIGGARHGPDGLENTHLTPEISAMAFSLGGDYQLNFASPKTQS